MTDESWPTTWERAEADRLSAMLRESERFKSVALQNDEDAQHKKARVLELHRKLFCHFQDHDDPDVYRAGVPFYEATPVADGQPNFTSANPDHLLAPIVLPAWSAELAFVVRPPWSVKRLLASTELLTIAPSIDLKARSPLNRHRCTWHDGPLRASSTGRRRAWLLTQVRGQYVGVWWVCARCREDLDALYRSGLAWHTPAEL